MKKTLIAAAILIAGTAHAGEHVKGYFRKNGTYVAPHVRSTPDSQRWNNYGPSSHNSGSYNNYGYGKRMNPYGRDRDRDGISNQFDMDDNNNGVLDDFERK